MKQSLRLNPGDKIRNLKASFQVDFKNKKHHALRKLHYIAQFSAENPEIAHLTGLTFEQNEEILIINAKIAGPFIGIHDNSLRKNLANMGFDLTRLNKDNRPFYIQRNPACQDLINRPGTSLYSHGTGMFRRSATEEKNDQIMRNK